jgi:hypothetical protein
MTTLPDGPLPLKGPLDAVFAKIILNFLRRHPPVRPVPLPVLDYLYQQAAIMPDVKPQQRPPGGPEEVET